MRVYFKRNEPFRFIFAQPISGKLYDINAIDSKPLHVSILDVSKNGAKVYCNDKHRLKSGNDVRLSFIIDDTTFDAFGIVSWTKHSKTSYEMGLKLNTDDSYHSAMLQSLKKLKRLKS